MRRRKHFSQTVKNKSYQGKILEDDQTDHHNKQTYLQLSPQEQHHVQYRNNNLSVFSIEDHSTSKVNDSEPVFQTIEEISKNVTENIQDVGERKSIEEKFCPKMNNDYHNKRSMVYVMITAKEMAKYRPSTPDIVRR